jgi:hypothetical protein
MDYFLSIKKATRKTTSQMQQNWQQEAITTVKNEWNVDKEDEMTQSNGYSMESQRNKGDEISSQNTIAEPFRIYFVLAKYYYYYMLSFFSQPNWHGQL